MMGRKKVLFLTTETGLKGGGEFFLRDAVRVLSPVADILCAVPAEGDLAQALSQAGAEIVYFRPSWPRRWKELWFNHVRLWRAGFDLRRHQIDLVYANAGHIAPFAVRLARKMHAKCVVHVHDIFDEQSQRKYLFHRADQLLACSEHVASAVKGCTGRVRVIYNGVDTDVFTPALKVDSCRRDEFRVGIMATIHPKKGFFEFVAMARRVAARIPSARFVMIGAPKPGEEEVGIRLRQEIAAAGLENAFVWKGFSSTPANDLAALDVLVFPSKYEAFGRVIAEAMACATPVVATDCGGPREIIRDGENGFLRPVDDVAGLADAVEKLYVDFPCRLRLASAGRASIVARFSMEKMAGDLQCVIEQITERRR